jgi:hypothetical protein
LSECANAGAREKAMAKQSGPRVGVKAVAFAVALGSCASSTGRWSQAEHTARDIARDLASCERAAERATLANLGSTRSGYGAENIPGVAGGSRGRDPMALHDRNEASGQFDDEVARCMKGLGYADARDR